MFVCFMVALQVKNLSINYKRICIVKLYGPVIRGVNSYHFRVRITRFNDDVDGGDTPKGWR